MNKNLKFLGYLLLNINQIRSSYRKKKTIFQKARHEHSLNIYIIYIAYKLLLKFYFPIERQPTFQKASIQMNFFGKSRCHRMFSLKHRKYFTTFEFTMAERENYNESEI